MIYCSNCGTAMGDDALFCPECGTKTQKVSSVGAIPVSTTAQSITTQAPSVQSTPEIKSANQTAKDVQNFLKVSLPDLIRKILFDPLDGTRKILSEIKEPATIGLYSILISSLIIPFLIYIRIPSEAKQGISFIEFFFKIFMLPLIGAFVITFCSFIIKAINNSRTANFANEILTGGVVSIGYAIFFIIAFFFSFFLQNGYNSFSVFNSFGDGPPTFTIILIFSVFVYLLIITSNALSQSLRSSGIKDGAAFYLAPIVVIISAYLTVRIWIALFRDAHMNSIF